MSHINLSTFVNGSGNLLIHLFNIKVAQDPKKWQGGGGGRQLMAPAVGKRPRGNVINDSASGGGG